MNGVASQSSNLFDIARGKPMISTIAWTPGIDTATRDEACHETRTFAVNSRIIRHMLVVMIVGAIEVRRNTLLNVGFGAAYSIQ
jgi:hypothetical protein